MISFNAINTQSVDLSDTLVEGSNVIPEGWHKIQLVDVGEEKRTASNNAIGATFKFECLDDTAKGLTFTRWFCTRALDASLVWSQKAFENIAVRIAQCVGVAQLNSVDDLFNKPFYAYLTAQKREYTSREVDQETGEFVKRTTVQNDFGKGKITEKVLSCAEYNDKYNSDKTIADFSFSMGVN